MIRLVSALVSTLSSTAWESGSGVNNRPTTEHPGKQADCNPSLLNFLINFSNQSKKLLCITAKMSVQWSTPGKFIQGLKFNYIDGKWPVFV